MRQFSADGLRLLKHLHPYCEDRDQIHRIAAWTELAFDEAKEKIDRYILTFLGKQKRFLSKQRAHKEMLTF